MYITNFYKNLFGFSGCSTILFDPVGVVRINNADRDELCKDFCMEELRNAVFGMEKNKAAGPDGFNADFYQKFWNVIKGDLFALVNDFFNKRINIDRLNCGVITLVPKGPDADTIQKYRPICLLNVVFKIITKILVNRLNPVIGKVIKFSRTAFLKNRFIMEGVVVLHETLNDLHVEKGAGVLFKIDFEKAFDKVKWAFLLQVLEMKGFPSKFNDLVMHIVSGGKVGIKVNGEVGPYFRTHQGLRQGDPCRLCSLT